MKDSRLDAPTFAFTHQPQLHPLWRALRADAGFYLFIAAYACTVALIASAIGAQRKMVPLSIYVGVLQAAIAAGVLMVVATGVLALLQPSPLRAWRSNLAVAAKGLPGVLLLLALALFLCAFLSMKQMLPEVVPLYADPMLADLDAQLHGGDPWRLTNALVPPALAPLLEKAYGPCWGAMKLASLLAVLFMQRLRHLRAQYLWTVLAIWTVLGNIVAGAVMSGGPVFYDELTGDAARFAAVSDFVARHTNQQWVQDLVWRAYIGKNPIGGGISAFPSLHVASTTLSALLAWRLGGWVRWAGVAFAAVILVGSVQLGWHYAVDGYFSIVATIGIWKAIGALQRRRAARL